MVDRFKIYMKGNGNGEYKGPLGLLRKAYDDVFDLDGRLKELGCTVYANALSTGTGQRSISVRSDSCRFDPKRFRRKFKFYRQVEKVEPIITDMV
jgi:hypothetical protein